MVGAVVIIDGAVVIKAACQCIKSIIEVSRCSKNNHIEGKTYSVLVTAAASQPAVAVSSVQKVASQMHSETSTWRSDGALVSPPGLAVTLDGRMGLH